ncbi:MAG: hypothetical protein WDW38_003940 [Sanguina aurantia]
MVVHATVSRLARSISNCDGEDGSIFSLTDEYFRFIALQVTSRLVPLRAPPAIEKLWCLHVLETQSYAHMCTCVTPGGALLHHSSLRLSPRDRLEGVARARQAYTLLFETPPPDSVWGGAEAGSSVRGSGSSKRRRVSGSEAEWASTPGRVCPAERASMACPAAANSPPAARQHQGVQEAGDDGPGAASPALPDANQLDSAGSSAGPVRICVKSLTRPSERFTVELDVTFLQVKALYESRTDVPVEMQRLLVVAHPRLAQDPETLREAGLTDGSELLVHVRLRGC